MFKAILKHSLLIFVLIAVGKIFSFLRDIIISAYFGANYTTDAYFAANNVPSILFTAIISSFLVLLIPTYKRIQIQNGFVEANLFVSRLLNLFFIFSILLSFSGFIFIEELIYLVAPGFNDETKNLAITLGKILVLSFPFSALALILSTISNANEKYFAPHIIPIFSALFVMISIIFFANDFGILVVAIAGVAAFLFQLILQIFISRNHFKYTFNLKLVDKDIKKMSWLVLPIFLGFSIDQINLLVNSIISSDLVEGSLSSLNYAQRLQATITGTFSTALITVIYPLISSLSVQNNALELTKIIKVSLRAVFLILTPIIIFLAFNSKSFVSIIYYRGKFDLIALDQTSNVFLFYCLSVVIISLREIILRLYYIKDNTKIPFITSALSLIINIILSLLLVKFLNVAGLALANLISTVIGSFVLFLLIRSKIGIDIRIAHLLNFTKKIFFPILVFILFQFFLVRYIERDSVLIFITQFIISLVVYYLLLLLFKQGEALMIIKMMKKRI